MTELEKLDAGLEYDMVVDGYCFLLYSRTRFIGTSLFDLHVGINAKRLCIAVGKFAFERERYKLSF